MVLVNISLISAKLKIVMLRKPAGFSKILCDLIIFRHKVNVNNMICHDIEDLQSESSRLGLELKNRLSMPYG